MLYFCADKTLSLWQENLPRLLDQNNKQAEVCHALSSVMKSINAWNSHKTLQECREACGGLGYSHYTGIGILLSEDDVNSTWEGDNHLLLQQTGRFLLKSAQGIMQGKQAL